ncbi:SDR family NAD(P)-dependent oxidoreductase [Alteribacillus bidgolensis]|uniref:NAD(P)-dependent dehydrogenase, short-chain alcohol dehydrogenase family n=1 Tax=Alteribacillus bidgolensis TaxID=930129 RepID=A0A1G8G3P3_9BACI|nr:SDR family NAD(P)-dependent oxidoreductase [Alteribacillus bidgolensis]SDH88969.1 NAD(P)-dependent dehydrogenase, short-chain alcohol dehydrogenase family [Alteribacillus bidgolensis]
MRLQGKNAVVTGAASGIGKAAAIRMAEEGASVLLCDKNVIEGEGAAKRIQADGGTALFIETDVTDEDSVRQSLQYAFKQWGAIDILFNNAGVSGKEKKLHEISAEEWDQVINTNLKGVFLGIKSVVPFMLDQGKGTIINTSSVLGFKGKKRTGPYNAAKGGLVTLTKNAALEYGRYGIRVNAIGPGVIDTPIIDAWRKDEKKWQIISSANALGRIGKPEEVAEAVLFLACDEASFITGETLMVDGGGLTF